LLSLANPMSNDARNSSSNYGTWVDVTAPGTQIWSTAIEKPVKCKGDLAGSDTDGWFANCNGTSMAAQRPRGWLRWCKPTLSLKPTSRRLSTASQAPPTTLSECQRQAVKTCQRHQGGVFSSSRQHAHRERHPNHHPGAVV
jgi:subtilisin family serine protease